VKLHSLPEPSARPCGAPLTYHSTVAGVALVVSSNVAEPSDGSVISSPAGGTGVSVRTEGPRPPAGLMTSVVWRAVSLLPLARQVSVTVTRR